MSKRSMLIADVLAKCIIVISMFLISYSCSYQNSSDPLSPASEQLSSDGTSHSKSKNQPASVEFDVEVLPIVPGLGLAQANDGQSYIDFPFIRDSKTRRQKIELEIPIGFYRSYYTTALASHGNYSRWISQNRFSDASLADHLILYDESGAIIEDRIIEDIKSFNRFSFSQNRDFFSVNGHQGIEIYSSHDLSKKMSINLPKEYITEPPKDPSRLQFTEYEIAIAENGETVLFASGNTILKYERNSEGDLMKSTLETPCDGITPAYISFINTDKEDYYYSDGKNMCLFNQGSASLIEGLPNAGSYKTVFFDDDDQILILVNNSKGNSGNIIVYDLHNLVVSNLFDPWEYRAKKREQGIRDSSSSWDTHSFFNGNGRYDDKDNLLILDTNSRVVYFLNLEISR